MPKIKKSFRLKKRDIEYIDTLVSKSIFDTQTQAVTYFIDFYRLDRGIELKLNRQINGWIYESYSKLWPFLFGCLFAFFFLRKSWFFIFPLLLSIMPMIFTIELIEPDKIKVRM